MHNSLIVISADTEGREMRVSGVRGPSLDPSVRLHRRRIVACSAAAAWKVPVAVHSSIPQGYLDGAVPTNLHLPSSFHSWDR
eukprot:s3751_g2.t1